MPDVPRLAWPLTLDGPALRVLEQDSAEEVQQCVRAILLHRVRDRTDVPEMGIADLTFGEQPLDLDGLADVVDRHEPRAAVTAGSTANPIDAAIADVRVEWQRRTDTEEST